MLEEEVRFVLLPDGRKVAYIELGCTEYNGGPPRTVLALHGLMSCRYGGIPAGLTPETLKKFGVRLIAIDRPGYGQSDCPHSLSLYSMCEDIKAIIDALDMGDQIWLLGISMGGAFCWAAARYIPDRIASIAMCNPVGSFHWKGLPKKEMGSHYSMLDTALFASLSFIPFCLIRWFARILTARVLKPNSDLTSRFSPSDLECFRRPGKEEQVRRCIKEALSLNNGMGLAKDYEIFGKKWGFELEDISKVYKKGQIHIWHGDEDAMMPLSFQRWIHMQLPHIVCLHELPNEGHFSWITSEDAPHYQILTSLFKHS